MVPFFKLIITKIDSFNDSNAKHTNNRQQYADPHDATNATNDATNANAATNATR